MEAGSGDGAALNAAAVAARPVSLAGEHVLPVLDALHPLLPDPGCAGARWWRWRGWRPRSLALALAAGPSAAGSWVGVVGVPSLGLAAAGELGVALDRLVLVAPAAAGGVGHGGRHPGRRVRRGAGRACPARLRAGDARRLQARVRDRGAVLCTVPGLRRHRARPHAGVQPWSAGRAWSPAPGHLQARRVEVRGHRPAGGGSARARPRSGCPTSGRVRADEHRPIVIPLRRGAEEPWSSLVRRARGRLVPRVAGRGGRGGGRGAGGRAPRQPGAGGVAPGPGRGRASSASAAGRRRAAAPALVLLDHDPARDARAFEPVLQALEIVTPWVEVTQPGACRSPPVAPRATTVVTRRSRPVLAVVTEALGPKVGRGRAAGVGVADGRFTADAGGPRRSASAVQGPVGRSWSRRGERGLPRPVPRGHLRTWTRRSIRSSADLLGRLGLRTLGALAPCRPGTWSIASARSAASPTGCARGGDERPPATRRPPPDLAVHVELEPPVQRRGAGGLRGQAPGRRPPRAPGRATAWSAPGWWWWPRPSTASARSGSGATSTGSPPPASPNGSAGSSRAGPPGPARRPGASASLRLVPDEVVPDRGRQLGFWGGQTQADERALRAVARLSAQVGLEAVAVPEWRGGRGPGEQLVLVPAATAELAEPAARARRVTPPSRAVAGAAAGPVAGHRAGRPGPGRGARRRRAARGGERSRPGQRCARHARARRPVAAGAWWPGPARGWPTSTGGTRPTIAAGPASSSSPTTAWPGWCASRAAAGGPKPRMTERRGRWCRHIHRGA